MPHHNEEANFKLSNSLQHNFLYRHSSLRRNFYSCKWLVVNSTDPSAQKAHILRTCLPDAHCFNELSQHPQMPHQIPWYSQWLLSLCVCVSVSLSLPPFLPPSFPPSLPPSFFWFLFQNFQVTFRQMGVTSMYLHGSYRV